MDASWGLRYADLALACGTWLASLFPQSWASPSEPWRSTFPSCANSRRRRCQYSHVGRLTTRRWSCSSNCGTGLLDPAILFLAARSRQHCSRPRFLPLRYSASSPIRPSSPSPSPRVFPASAETATAGRCRRPVVTRTGARGVGVSAASLRRERVNVKPAREKNLGGNPHAKS